MNAVDPSSCSLDHLLALLRPDTATSNADDVPPIALGGAFVGRPHLEREEIKCMHRDGHAKLGGRRKLWMRVGSVWRRERS